MMMNDDGDVFDDGDVVGFVPLSTLQAGPGLLSLHIPRRYSNSKIFKSF